MQKTQYEEVQLVAEALPLGFTRKELQLLAICLCVMLAIGLPLRARQAARSYRVAAQLQLLQAAEFMQAFHAHTGSYLQDRTNMSLVWDHLPAQLRRSPATGVQLYEISVVGPAKSDADDNSFTLRMMPVPGLRMDGDKCGGFSLNQAGVRGVTAANASARACWR